MSHATAMLRTMLVSATLTMACAAVAHDNPGASRHERAGYSRQVLVSNTVPANFADPNLGDSWGVAFNPTGVVWVNNAATGKSTLYDGAGRPQSLVVAIPGTAAGTVGSPTGIVFSGGADFVVSNATARGPARFIFATLQGTISGWAPNVELNNAIPAVPNSSGAAVYTGLALGGNGTTHLLYAANFSEGRVDVFDGTFAPVTLAGGFTDRHLPRSFAPFGIQAINGDIYVTYAQRDPATGLASVQEPGHSSSGGRSRNRVNGFVNVFDPQGRLIRRVASGGALNAPWGLALAPASFGKFAGALLVGNQGDGTINAYGPRSGRFLGSLSDTRGRRLHIEGLWGLGFGNGVQAQQTTSLFYAAGTDPSRGAAGEYGVINAVVE